MSDNKYNYLFVSDFHIAMGLDPTRKTYNPREDFHYDDEFFRFLRWADEHREDKKPWELVFVGDCFDFLPVDLSYSDEYRFWRKELSRSLIMDEDGFLSTWLELFTSALPRKLQSKLIEPYLRHEMVEINETKIDRKRQEYADEYEFWRSPEFNPSQSNVLYAQELPLDYSDEDPSMEEISGKPVVPEWVGVLAEKTKPPERNGNGGETVYVLKNLKKSSLQVWLFRLRLALRRLTDFAQFEYAFFTEEASTEKLRTIFRGHLNFFEALSWWVARGHRLVIMAGNHDLEIRWQGVQELFKALLVDRYRNCVRKWEEVVRGDEKAINDHYNDLVDFGYPWFYYKAGVFYAQHGAQYDNVNSAVNLLSPYWKKKTGDGEETLLNPSIGNIGNPIVSDLEDSFPEWENVGTHGSTLSYYIREYPWRVFRLLMRNFWQYAILVITILNGARNEKAPSDEELKEKVIAKEGHQDLPLPLVRELYQTWDRPILDYPVRWLGIPVFVLLALISFIIYLVLSLLRILLSLRGFFLFVLALVIVALLNPIQFKTITGYIDGISEWFGDPELIINRIAKIIEDYGLLFSIFGFIVGLWFSGLKELIRVYLSKENKKFFQVPFFGHEYIREGGRQTYKIFDRQYFDGVLQAEQIPQYYIFGHDHDPYRMLLNEDDFWAKEYYYLNAGSWLSWFVGESTRRLQTGGGDLDFTFIKIYQQPADASGGFQSAKEAYQADLLRWNDTAGRVDYQIIIEPKKRADPIAKLLERPYLFLANLGAILGLIIGSVMGRWWLGSLIGAAAGGVIGWFFNQWLGIGTLDPEW
jgi:UDP-2,3-diacylglucosamine pyrophosphatase LpxH